MAYLGKFVASTTVEDSNVVAAKADTFEDMMQGVSEEVTV